MIRVIFVCLLALTSCAPRMARIVTALRDSASIHTERIIDTMRTQADSALLAALLECDSLGRVRIARLEAENGRLMAQTLELEDNLLQVRARADVRERWREVIRSDTVILHETMPVPYPVERTEYRLRSWQRWLCWIGVFYLLRTLLKIALGGRGLTIGKLLTQL